MDIEAELTNLKGRIDVLEAIVGTQTPIAPWVDPGQAVAAPPPGIPATGMATTPTTPPPPSAGSVPYSPGYSPDWDPTAAVPKADSAFEFGIESLLRWAGVALVTLAGIFLVSTAISRGWIGPELQLLSAALGGAGLLGGSVKLSDTRRPWALALGCGGAVVLAASAISTYEWLELVGPTTSIGLTALVTGASYFVAMRTRLGGIALAASLAAMIGALDTLGELGDAATLGWITALILISAAVGLTNQWPGLRIVTGGVGSVLLAIYSIAEEVDGLLRALGFVGTAIVAATLWTAPTIANQIADRTGDSGNAGRFDWKPLDYRLVALVPGWVWIVVSGLLALDDANSVGVVALVTAVGFGGLAALSIDRTDRLISLSTLFGSLTLLAVGFALLFDGPALMVALAGQAVTSYFMGRKLDDLPLRFSGYLAGAASSVLALYEMAKGLDNGGFDDFGAALGTLIVVAMWIGGAVGAYIREDAEIPFEIPFVGAWVGSMFWFATLLSDLSQGLGLISAAWALMACAGLIIGLQNRIGIVKNVALVTLGLTLVKLVTVDMAGVDVFWRVGLFFVVGMGLIALGLKIPALMGSTSGEEDATDDSEVQKSNL
jgi:uncharacterized membrane protein